MRVNLKHIFTGVSLILNVGLSAQENLFLNQVQSLVFLNPSFAGSNGLIRDQTVYKKNLSSDGAMSNFANAIDAYIEPIKAGIAAYYSYNSFNFVATKTDKFSLAYAQYISSKNKKIDFIPSARINFGRNFYDTTSSSSYLPSALITKTMTSYFDFDLGFLIKVKNIRIGSTLSHINHPESIIAPSKTEALNLGIHASYNLFVSEKAVVNFLVSYAKQGTYEGQFQLTTNAVVFKHLLIGIGYFSNGIGYFSNNQIFANLGFRTNCITASILYASNLDINNRLYFAENMQLMLAYHLKKKDQRKSLGSFESW